MVVGDNKSTATKMKVNHWQIQLPWQCGGTTRGALPDREGAGLHLNPLDAAIRRVPAMCCPSGRHGQRIC